MKNIGILGPGNIANRVAKGVICSPKANLYAVASRNIDKAKSFADKYGAEIYYGSYEEMLNDPNVDLVYICTPNTFHYEQIKLCLVHGKHVICEKPMVKDEAQIREIFAMAREKNCFLLKIIHRQQLPIKITISFKWKTLQILHSSSPSPLLFTVLITDGIIVAPFRCASCQVPSILLIPTYAFRLR